MIRTLWVLFYFILFLKKGFIGIEIEFNFNADELQNPTFVAPNP
jgi:hypothetical protein